MDLGDKTSRYCVLNEAGEVVLEDSVANARKVQPIGASSKNDDRMDAKMLARLARVDPELLGPIRHRSEEAQLDPMEIRVRAALVEARTSSINTARGLAKPEGQRLPSCDAGTMDAVRLAGLPPALAQVLKPPLNEVESLTERIEESNERVEQIAGTKYPETEQLRQVGGVGSSIALVLTIEDPARFAKSRQ